MDHVDLVEDYLAARGSRKDSPHTTAAYRSDLMTVLETIGDEPLTLSTMRRAFNTFAATREGSSVRRAWSTWSGFFDHLVHEGVVDGNPMAGVARPATPRRTPRSFDPDATARILSALAAPDSRWPEQELAVVTTLLLTGVRSAELLGLNVGSLTGGATEQRIIVRGKGDSDRSVPVEAPLVDLLVGYQESRLSRFPEHTDRSGEGSVWQRLPSTAPMFVGRDGERLTRGKLQYLVRGVYRRAGVDSQRQRGALVHALRHTFATRVIENPDVTVVQLMEILGHRSMATTQNYVKAAGRETRAAVASNPVYSMLPPR